MAENISTRRVASFLRRFPWLFVAAYAFWRVMFQAKFSVGVVGVVFNDHVEVLLVEHTFHPRYTWGLPGGWVDRNEDPATAVRREILEELSLEVEVGPILLAETPHKNHLDLAFLCQAVGDIGPLNYELLDYGWFNFEELPKILDVHRRAIQYAMAVRRSVEHKT